ncbi:MAG: DUF2344 domain-containing protein [Chloroflexi bacterium]|nr:DUF2344 domain-containing protein [Chloroflexota bacterium]
MPPRFQAGTIISVGATRERNGAPVQRLRITFAKGDELRYISHLDLTRVWERLLRRAGIPLAYSRGFNPHPRMSFAAPLQVGATGRAEVLDVVLERAIAPEDFTEAVQAHFVAGLRISAVAEVDLGAPSLQAQVRALEYRVELAGEMPHQIVADRIERFLGAPEVVRDRRREGQSRRYDLRPLVEDISLEDPDGHGVLWMRLKVTPSGTGRPDELLDALGLGDSLEAIERTALVLET